MTTSRQFLGTVHRQRFRQIDPGGELDLVMRLTSLPMQAGQAPEAGQIDLARYEGKAILVADTPAAGGSSRRRSLKRRAPS